MSAGIAAAIVRAVCKHQQAQIAVDMEEVTKQFAFSAAASTHPEAFEADVVDSIAPVHRFIMQWSLPNIDSV